MACLGPTFGRKRFQTCKCKERAASFFKIMHPDLLKQAEEACKTANNPAHLVTEQQFYDKMGLTDADLIRAHGFDPNPGQGEDLETGGNKIVTGFGVLIVILIIALLYSK